MILYPKIHSEYIFELIFSYEKKKVKIWDIDFSVHFEVVALVKRGLKWMNMECCIDTNCYWYLKKTRNTHKNEIRHISTLLRYYLNQSNHHTMHRKVKILNMMFLFLITENQFKVVFKVNFWSHYQIGHNFKDWILNWFWATCFKFFIKKDPVCIG